MDDCEVKWTVHIKDFAQTRCRELLQQLRYNVTRMLTTCKEWILIHKLAPPSLRPCQANNPHCTHSTTCDVPDFFYLLIGSGSMTQVNCKSILKALQYSLRAQSLTVRNFSSVYVSNKNITTEKTSRQTCLFLVFNKPFETTEKKYPLLIQSRFAGLKQNCL